MSHLDEKLKLGIEKFDIEEAIMSQWQEIVTSMAKLMDVPAGLIMRLNDKKIEVFTTSKTENNPYKFEDSEHFFDSGLYCETVIRTNDRLHVPDALKDEHWKDNPDVALNMISYLGFPIMNEDQTPFGTLCVLDNKERHYKPEEEHLIIEFRNMLESHLKLINTSKSLEKANESIRESVEYASQIQRSLIIDERLLNNFFEDSFTIWEPKDTVGGDIYFVKQFSVDEMLIIFVDCTGHGISGAFFTMIVKAIEQQVDLLITKGNKKLKPSEILSIFNKRIKKIFSNSYQDTFDHAGFDGAVVYINKEDQTLSYSGAKMPLYCINNDNEIEVITGDKYSVGYKSSDEDYKFKEHSISAKEYKSFYLSTDGYQDQLGGENSFPFGKSAFANLILKNNDLPFKEQSIIFKETIENYRGHKERVDDISMIGFKL
jgi:serine phosphatase RsbU (regulator of sigma subunit)